MCVKEGVLEKECWRRRAWARERMRESRICEANVRMGEG
jgi:hypothetical protein